jgi:hypothetical protein
VSEADQNLNEAAQVALINVVPRGDDQVHLIEFLRSTSEVSASSEDLLLCLREICLPEVIAKNSITNNRNLFWQEGSSSPHTERTFAEEQCFPSSKEYWKLCLIMINLSIKRPSVFGRPPQPKL